MKKIFLDLDGTLARFNVRNALSRFDNEVGFFAKLLAYKGIEKINEMAETGNVYIISASPNEQADIDKISWIVQYLPNINLLTNVFLVRLRQNKAEYLKDKGITITKECYLLDDYTKNLIEWEQVGGTGIKRITSVADNSTGKWQGLICKRLEELNRVIT